MRRKLRRSLIVALLGNPLAASHAPTTAQDDSRVQVDAFPHGIDETNEGILEYWRQKTRNNDPIPSARVMLQTRVYAGPIFENLVASDSELQLEREIILAIKVTGDGIDDIETRLPLTQFFDMNLGAFGEFRVTCEVFYGSSGPLAYGETAFRVGPMALSAPFRLEGLKPTAPSQRPGPPLTMPANLVDGAYCHHYSNLSLYSDHRKRTRFP